MGLSHFRHQVPKLRQAHIFVIIRSKAAKLQDMMEDILMYQIYNFQDFRISRFLSRFMQLSVHTWVPKVRQKYIHILKT